MLGSTLLAQQNSYDRGCSNKVINPTFTTLLRLRLIATLTQTNQLRLGGL
ncbi:hypothetical protein MAH4_36570 [Sessilibacter sp. MAH4]